MKILFLDIETSPNTAYVWGLFKETIPLARLIETSYIMCYSALWLGEEELMFDSVYHTHPENMLLGIHGLLEEADAVVHYNGKRFDIPTLNKDFIKYKMSPPSPYRQIDLYETVKSQFRFTSNKLDHVVKELGLGSKYVHPGFEMWVDCMNNNKEAWNEMKKYNLQDVVILEKLYHRLLPWIRNHPNFGLYSVSPKVCPNCGGKHYQSRGKYYSSAGIYNRYQCQSCWKWFKDAATIKNNQAPKASERFSEI